MKKVIVLLIAIICIGVCCACVLKSHSSDNTCNLKHENGLYIYTCPLTKNFLPEVYLSNSTETVESVAKRENVLFAINSGFFDARNKKTVSYISIGNNIIANPKENQNLITNPELLPYLDQIYNRGELRIMSCSDNITANIVYHNEAMPNNCELLNATQAGPVILPDMDLEKEFFILKKNGKIVRDGAVMMGKTSRSAVALKSDHISFIITDENTPLTIYELRNKLKSYEFDKAMGFDGGGSVSMYVASDGNTFYQHREKNNTSRPVKSMIIIRKK